MPHRTPEFTEVTQRLAARFSLSRQTAQLLALLIVFPAVSKNKLYDHFGDVAHKNIVRRLRHQMRDADIKVTTLVNMGYCLDEDARARLKIMTAPEHNTERLSA